MKKAWGEFLMSASKFPAGSSFGMTVTLSDKTTGEPVPVSDYQIFAQVRAKSSGVLVESLSVEALTSTSVEIKSAGTDSWPQGLLEWNIMFVETSTGFVSQTSVGQIDCYKPPTRRV